MSLRQQSKRGGRQRGHPAKDEHVASGSKDDGAGVAPEAGNPKSLHDVEGKEARTYPKDKSSALGRHSERDSLGSDYPESAVFSRNTNVTSPSVDNLKEGVSSNCFHLDDDEMWHAICVSTFNQRGDTKLLADTLQRKLSVIKDYQFLLEAVRCETLGVPNLRDTCIRLYLLVKSCGPAPPGSHVNKARFHELSAEYLSGSNEEFAQIASQLQRMLKRKAFGDERVERELSVSQISYPEQAWSPQKKNNKMPLRPSFGEKSRSRRQNHGTKEELDVGYHKKDSKWYTVGRVFTMLWHANATGVGHTEDTGFTSTGPYNQKIYSQIRRFAVIKQGHGFSWAIPINTYHGKGISRDSFDEEDHQAHAIIYMEDTKPERLPGEPVMLKTPIMVDKTSEDKKLHPASRIRFDKVFTIEHNVRVKNVGKISAASMPYFRLYWQEQLAEFLKTEATI
ncbi:uncharacterized protein Z519_10860 [Cladophialophora bantiana CBS 173.52]|uniref:DUF6590 domain-containing protein n=1 Tax=Cladophialophora bantiana (strain ATCC 10958 / CBS 173.52 / CDC B-1940 / NIH 8579) TaxID=1442370 RepID=A0A0D2H4S4_CLAB1|nr:uncharacterized protein Z519_10860 [Cladophialophora bantiana CBS 173.52]KIW88293.1 hypothetical protein Z519_10860 [Cladophialophora bantiana CBS 173.52]